MNPVKAKIGIAVITCNRPDLFSQCISSIPSANTIIVVNDGKEYSSDIYTSEIKAIIQHKNNMGVAVSKNDALKYLMNDGCDRLFLCEDDVKVKRQDIYDAYISTAESSGLHHLNFAYHGPANKDDIGRPKELLRVKFGNNVFLSFHYHLTGAFSYYSRSVIEKVGLMDERFLNAYDHLDHTLQIIKAKLHPPFGWFADIADSHLFIEDLDADLSRSVIRQKKFQFRLRYKLYSYLFKRKNGFTAENYPRATESEFFKFLTQYTNYKLK